MGKAVNSIICGLQAYNHQRVLWISWPDGHHPAQTPNGGLEAPTHCQPEATTPLHAKYRVAHRNLQVVAVKLKGHFCTYVRSQRGNLTAKFKRCPRESSITPISDGCVAGGIDPKSLV